MTGRELAFHSIVAGTSAAIGLLVVARVLDRGWAQAGLALLLVGLAFMLYSRWRRRP